MAHGSGCNARSGATGDLTLGAPVPERDVHTRATSPQRPSRRESPTVKRRRPSATSGPRGTKPMYRLLTSIVTGAIVISGLASAVTGQSPGDSVTAKKAPSSPARGEVYPANKKKSFNDDRDTPPSPPPPFPSGGEAVTAKKKASSAARSEVYPAKKKSFNDDRDTPPSPPPPFPLGGETVPAKKKASSAARSEVYPAKKKSFNDDRDTPPPPPAPSGGDAVAAKKKASRPSGNESAQAKQRPTNPIGQENASRSDRVLSPAEAAKRVGERVTVELTVRSVGTNPAGFEELYSGRTWQEDGSMFIRFPEAARQKFRKAGTPDVLKRYLGKTIRVTGQVELVRLSVGDHVVIVVNDVNQVELVAAMSAAADAPDKPSLVIDAGGHTARINQVAFSPHSDELISISSDKTVRIWSLKSGTAPRVLRPPIGNGSDGALWALAVSPRNDTLAVGGIGSRDNGYPFYLLNRSTGRMMRRFEGHSSSVLSLSFAADGQRLASASYDHTARIWDSTDGRCLTILRGHTDTVKRVAFSPDGRRVATVSVDNTVRIWSADDGRELAVLKGRSGPVTAAVWQPDGTALATYGSGRSIQLWHPDGKLVRSVDDLEGSILSLAFSRDGRTVLYTWESGPSLPNGCALFNLASGEQMARFSRHSSAPVACALSQDGATAASADTSDIIYVWRAADATLVNRLAPQGRIAISAGWSGDAQTVAWGHTSGAGQTGGVAPLERSFDLASLGFSETPNDSFFRGRGSDGGLTLKWKSGSVVAVMRGAEEVSTLAPAAGAAIRQFTILPRSRAAVATQSTLQYYDMPSGRLLCVLAGHSGPITCLAPSPNGRFLLSAGTDMSLRIWDLRGVEATVASHSEFGIGLSGVPDGEAYIVTVLTPGLPVSRDGAIKINDKIIAIAPDGKAFVDLRGKSLSDIRGLLRGTAGSSIRLRTTRADVSGTSEHTFTRERLAATASPMLSLFFSGDDWVAWTPEGYYAASPGGERLVGWHINNGRDAMASFYSASQFRKSLYRPDVIKLILKEGNLREALAAAGNSAGSPRERTEVASILPPKVSITSPTGSRYDPGREPLKVEAVARSVGGNRISAMRLLLDGRPVPNGVKTFSSPVLGEARAKWSVEVPPGAHQLIVKAESGASQGLSDPLDLGTPAAPAQSGVAGTVKAAATLYVLAIGINDYPEKRLKLECAAPDAEALRQAFLTYSRRLFKGVETKLLLNRQATRADIANGLKWLTGKVKSGDVAVVFYAGHGFCSKDGVFYLVPVDANVRDLKATGISGESLEKAIGELPCTTMLVLDACYAASIGEKKRKTRALPVESDAVLRHLIYDSGLVVMCGSYKDQEAAEENGHGFFTQAIVEGLSGKADKYKIGRVEIDDLQTYVKHRVRELSGNEQEPTIGIPPTVRSFPLSRP
jgi:WD40 repeat protein